MLRRLLEEALELWRLLLSTKSAPNRLTTALSGSGGAIAPGTWRGEVAQPREVRVAPDDAELAVRGTPRGSWRC